MSMKALVIAPEPFFVPRGTPFSVYYRTLVSARLGVSVDLLTYGQGEDVEIPGVRVIRVPGFRWLGAIRVGPSALKAFFDLFLIVWTVGLLLTRRYDWVHAHEESVFWCLFLKPIFRFRLVYDMHSSLPQQLTNFEFTESRRLIRLFEYLEALAVKRSDAIVTICPDLWEYSLSMGTDPKRHFLIENSVFEAVRLRHGEGEAECGGVGGVPDRTGPRILYAGTLEPYQGVDLLVPAFARVVSERTDAQLVIVGGAPEQVMKMRQLAAACGVGDRCVFSGQVGKQQVRQLLETADVLVSPRRSGTNTPLKIYEQMASGKPLVATRIRSHTQVLAQKSCFWVEPTVESIAAGLLEALNDPERAVWVGGAARRRYEERYSYGVYVTKMRQLIEVLV